MATIAFFVDFGYFLKTRGIPCRKGSNQPTDTARPEIEKLNSNGTE